LKEAKDKDVKLNVEKTNITREPSPKNTSKELNQ
jgi:hypothetical protein